VTRGSLALAVALALSATWTSAALAQAGGGRRKPQSGGEQAPPEGEQKGPTPEEQEEIHNAYMRSEPSVAPPSDPLAIPPSQRARIGTDWMRGPPSPEGSLEHKQWFPFYEEERGDYRLRLLPPFLLEQSRGLTDPSQRLYGVPRHEDTEGLYGLLYYRRRSLDLDMDVVFPAFWRVRDKDSNTLVVGPFAHREAPKENDNWLAPLFFTGSRADGGYFVAPPLLTYSQWSKDRDLTIAMAGLYFRSRSGTDTTLGTPPLFFYGNNGNTEGNQRTYTFIPPALFYHSYHEFDGSHLTVAGPVIVEDTPKYSVFDVAPFYFHSVGHPETGGVPEEHTTLFPFFHYGRDPEKSLFILPGYYREVTHTEDTLLSLFYSRVIGRSGATELQAAGPIVPLWWNYRDRDLGIHTWAIAPLWYESDRPTGHDWLTPLVGHFQTYGESSTWWAFPSFTFSSNQHGWEDALHPLVYIGRNDQSTHTVVAPFFWDFADPKSRVTVGFPVYWRFAEGQGDSVIQVAANTVYIQKRVANGMDWQFHLVPLFSYGEDPEGYFWNVLFGLAGYSRHGLSQQVRALWIPFNSGPQQQPAAPSKAASSGLPSFAPSFGAGE
jgi:hypothetical protein